MNKFTVILLYPSLPLAACNETYYARVTAEDHESAIKAGRREAFYGMAPSDRRGGSPKNFRALTVIDGHVPVYDAECHQLLKPKYP